jgi:hypothetical protein
VRVLLDTNVLLSALVVRGPPPERLYEAWRRGRIERASWEHDLE